MGAISLLFGTPVPTNAAVPISDGSGSPGASLDAWVTDGSGSAPADAKYIIQTVNASLPNAQILSALTTGLVKNTTGTGILSIGAAGTDYVSPGAITTSGLTMATARLLGRGTASSGAIEEITVGTGLNLSVAGVLTATGTGGTVTHTGALTANQVVVGNGTDDVKILAAGTNGWVLTLVAGVPAWTVLPAGTTPGGSNTQLQYNNSSAFGGISGATTNGTAVTFTAGNLIATSPKIITGINDTNGNELFLLTATASAVNEITYANAATGNKPQFLASGGDSNIGIEWRTKGTGEALLTSTGINAILRIQSTTNGGSARLRINKATTGSGGFLEFLTTGNSDEYYMGVPDSGVIAGGNTFGIIYYNGSADQLYFTLDTGGVVKMLGTTDASSASTGTIVTTGGAGIAKKLYVGSATASTSTSTGAIVLTGASAGIGLPGAIFAGGTFNKTNTAATDSVFFASGTSTTGANYLTITNTQGAYQVGTENSTSAAFGFAPYALFFRTPAGATFGWAIAGTGIVATLTTTGFTTTGSVTTGAPSGGTAAAWKMGTVSVTSPTAPNRTIELDVAGTRYFIAAKTTND